MFSSFGFALATKRFANLKKQAVLKPSLQRCHTNKRKQSETYFSVLASDRFQSPVGMLERVGSHLRSG